MLVYFRKTGGGVMKRMVLFSFVLTTNFCVLAICYAETFYLKNGDIVEGVVVEEIAENIKLKRATIKNPESKYPLHANVYYLQRKEIVKTEEAGVLSKEFLGGEYGEEEKVEYKNIKSWDYYQSGLDFAIVGEFEKAEKGFQDALKVDRFYTPAIESLRLIDDVFRKEINKEIAVRLFKVGTSSGWTSKIKESEEIASLEPDYMMTHIILGIIYLKNDMLNKAMIEFEKAIQIEHDSAIAHNNLGVSYFYKGMLSEAAKEFEAALQFNPSLAEAGSNYVLIKMMQKGIELKESDAGALDLINFKCITSSILIDR